MLVKERTNSLLASIPEQESPVVFLRKELILFRLRMIVQYLGILLKKTINPFLAIKVLRKVLALFLVGNGEAVLNKAVKVDGRYYWQLFAPGFPSKNLVRMQRNELDRFFPDKPRKGMRSIIFGITKKCALKCEHCYEWNNLNKQETLSTKDLIKIIHTYQDYGTTQIMLSGGEPMLRVNDIYHILNVAKPDTDFWVITSGLGLSKDRAEKLKAEGLTGVLVSLDHHDEAMHNSFRGFEGAYNGAIQAVAHANQAGLVTALSLCCTKEFTTEENLTAYMELAKKLGVSFVQLLEPRATGRYTGKDVRLDVKDILLLEKTYLTYNAEKKFREYPIIIYHGYHQKKIGCLGSGNMFFYIDTDGDAHACPFCSHKVGNTLDHSAEEIVNLLEKSACHVFNKSLLTS